MTRVGEDAHGCDIRAMGHTIDSEAGNARACGSRYISYITGATHKKCRLAGAPRARERHGSGESYGVSTRHAKDWRGRCVTQLTLGHDGLDGDALKATRGSSELGEDADREEEEEEDDGEVDPEAIEVRALK